MNVWDFFNKRKERLQVTIPEEIKMVFYHLHTVGRGMKPAVPAITVALAVHANGDVVGRGVAVCSPDDYSSFSKKEGHLRAAARAVRAYKKAKTGGVFTHPKAIRLLQEIFSLGIYDEYLWDKDYYITTRNTHKHQYMPTITTGEQELIENKGW